MNKKTQTKGQQGHTYGMHGLWVITLIDGKVWFTFY